MMVMASLEEKGGTLSCSRDSDCVTEGVKISGRVDIICPNLIKMGPRSMMARVSRSPRGLDKRLRALGNQSKPS